MKLRLGTLILLAVAVPWMAAAAVSVRVPLPADVQIALLKNIFKLDRNFDCAKGVTIAIAYQESYDDSVSAKDEIVAAIERQKLKVKAVVPLEIGTQQLLSERLYETDADLVYVMPLRALDVTEIGRISRYRKFRTFTGVPEYVEEGIAVGIGIKRDRPLIIVNIVQARAEGAAFSSQLLALARIVGTSQ